MRITYDGRDLEVDDELSFRDFTGQDFGGRSGIDFSRHWVDSNPPGNPIYASCFSQEVPDSEIFPDDLIATFLRCNLSNVRLPAGCTATDCNQTRFRVQNDLRDWEIDEADQPVKVLNEKYWRQQSVFVDPARIPAQKIEVDVRRGETLDSRLRELSDGGGR